MCLHADESGLLWGRGESAPRRLWVAGKLEAVHYLIIDRDCQIRAVNRDLVIVPFTDRMHHEATIGRSLKRVDSASPVDRCAVRPGELVDLHFETKVDTYVRRIVVALLRRIRE